MSHSEKISELLLKTLEDSTLFKKVSPLMVKELADKMTVSDYEEGETIIKKDDEGMNMYFIVSGEVKIHDREHLLAKLGKGEFFGEMSILDREPRSMSVTALEATITGSIVRSELFEVINRFPGMTVELIGFLSRRLRKLNKFMVEQLRNREKELEQLVEERTADLARKNAELEEAILKIRESQQQLIMQEKLASLGSLTAGVAHELHNPLNFVNNFTELSLELLNEHSEKGKSEGVIINSTTIKNNLEKILHHGQRAETIIKSMIMHSNSGSGKPVMTNINELCDQSLNMVSYASANNLPGCSVRIEKYFEDTIPALLLIPRDISKALINLLNNAFYEVNRKWKIEGTSYEPKISMTTFRKKNDVVIVIEDNGDGVVQTAKDKIFEPFYTNKPSGEGVGLGLSISNDIIRAHGGTLNYERTRNGNTKFSVSLPVS